MNTRHKLFLKSFTTNSRMEAECNGTYLAQVDLPDQAVVQKMTLYYHRGSTEKTINAFLMRSIDGTSNTMASISSLTDEHKGSITTISSATIDNSDCDYWAYLYLPSYSPGDMRVYGMTIEYAFPANAFGILAISDPAFTGFHHDYDYENHGLWLFHLHGEDGGDNNGKYLAPVYLPQGATVTGISSTIYDGSNTLTGSAYLYRCKLGVNETMASVTTPVGGTPGYQKPSESSIAYDMIDNAQYAYYVWWSLPVSTLPDPPELTILSE